MNNDGYITIGTKVDTKGIEDGIKKIEDKTEQFNMDFLTKKIDQFEKKIKSLEERFSKKEIEPAMYEMYFEQYTKQIELLKKTMADLQGIEKNETIELQRQEGIKNKIKETEETIDAIRTGEDIESINSKLIMEEQRLQVLKDRFSSLNEEIEVNKQKLEEVGDILLKNNRYAVEYEYLLRSRDRENADADYKRFLKLGKMHLDEEEIKEQEEAYQRLIKSVNALVNKQELLALTIEKQKKKVEELKEATNGIDDNIEDVNFDISDLKKSLKDVVKSVGKWALALVGIRGAISLLTRSFNTLTQYNEELAQKVSDIRLSLAVLLEPIIVRIVDLVYLILQYLNLLSTAWFGIDMFARASELSANKLAKNLASGAGSAKEIKNQLAGFDEMNVLQEPSSGGGGGASTPGFNLKGLEGDVPKWLDWIIKKGPEIISLIAGITAGLIAMKLFGLDPLKTLGIALLVAGLVETIMGLLNYLKDPTWENFGRIINGIGLAILGLGIIIGNVPLIVAGAIVTIVGLIIKYWDEISKFINEKIIGFLDKKFEELINNGNVFLAIIIGSIRNFITLALNFVNGWIQSLKDMLDGIIEFIKGVFTGNWKQAWEGIKKFFKGYIDSMTGIIQVWFNYGKELLSKIYPFIKEKVDAVKTLFYNMAVAIGDFFSGAIKGAINGALSWVENKVNTFIRMINSVISIINKIPGVSISKLSTISLPRLATGAIINQPGRGVPVGNAIAGEAGREGILPLTDERAMAMLGREIGKWITVNANIPVSIGNRQIAREVRQLMAQDDFAMNN